MLSVIGHPNASFTYVISTAIEGAVWQLKFQNVCLSLLFESFELSIASMPRHYARAKIRKLSGILLDFKDIDLSTSRKYFKKFLRISKIRSTVSGSMFSFVTIMVSQFLLLSHFKIPAVYHSLKWQFLLFRYGIQSLWWTLFSWTNMCIHRYILKELKYTSSMKFKYIKCSLSSVLYRLLTKYLQSWCIHQNNL